MVRLKNKEMDSMWSSSKVYKVVLTLTKEDQSTEEVTALLNEKGEAVKE